MLRKFVEFVMVLLSNVKTTDHVGDLEMLRWIVVDVFETDRRHLVLHVKRFLLLPARRSAPRTDK
jgi:hypothetical protein